MAFYRWLSITGVTTTWPTLLLRRSGEKVVSRRSRPWPGWLLSATEFTISSTVSPSAPALRKAPSLVSASAWPLYLKNFLMNLVSQRSHTFFNIMALKLGVLLGDFAILISSGMSVRRALAFNFASACTAFLGLVLGIALESFQINSYIFGLAGRLFLYISLSDLVIILKILLLID